MKKTSFYRWVNEKWRMRLFLFWKLPAAWFMGMYVVQCDAHMARVALPYRWRSQNPFRSTYFAAQCAAAELSTGLLGLAELQEMPPVSMLVTAVRAEFYKKADRTLVFECKQGEEIAQVIKQAVATGAAQEIVMESSGYLPDGTLAARVWIHWSFKRKSKNV